MRQGLASGALVVSHYMRSIFPYERAHEKGMGMVQEVATARVAERSSASAGNTLDLEAKLLADELRALGRQRAEGSQPRLEDTGARVVAVTHDITADEPPTAADPSVARADDRLGLDAFDEDQDVRPVVLLSRKRRSAERHADGAFMTDLERRLEADAQPRDAQDAGAPGATGVSRTGEPSQEPVSKS
jgi:hypothetical protein